MKHLVFQLCIISINTYHFVIPCFNILCHPFIYIKIPIHFIVYEDFLKIFFLSYYIAYSISSFNHTGCKLPICIISPFLYSATIVYVFIHILLTISWNNYSIVVIEIQVCSNSLHNTFGQILHLFLLFSYCNIENWNYKMQRY